MTTHDDETFGTPLFAHALELRRRLVIAFLAFGLGCGICYFFAQDIYAFLVRPLVHAGGERRMIYTGLSEAFVTYMRIALWGGGILAFPIIAAQIWFFVSPGLYNKERNAFLPFLIASPVFFFLGAALAYWFVFPMAWKFFLSFETPALVSGLSVSMEARMSEYLSLSMSVIFAFGLAFQLPVLLVLLAKVGLVSAEKLAKSRRFAVVFIFIVAAVLTPPDVISQIALAAPLMALYELSILGARWAEKRR